MLHTTIKDQIKEAMRAKDTVRLETLRGLEAMFQNEMLAAKAGTSFPGSVLPDDRATALIRRSIKQRKDSIQQFMLGKREDLADKESKELAILESFLPPEMSRDQVAAIVKKHIDTQKALGGLDPKSIGKLTGMIMKELAGKADGMVVKQIVEEMVKEA